MNNLFKQENNNVKMGLLNFYTLGGSGIFSGLFMASIEQILVEILSKNRNVFKTSKFRSKIYFSAKTEMLGKNCWSTYLRLP